MPARGLYAHFVMSPKANATFTRLDATAALKMVRQQRWEMWNCRHLTGCVSQPGVVAFFSAADIPGENQIGPVFHDEELFVSANQSVCVCLLFI